MKKTKKIGLSLAVISIIGFSGCGGGGSGDGTPTAYFVDSAVGGITYSSASYSGVTSSNGGFHYADGETTTFKIGAVTLGSISSIPSDGKVMPQDIAGIARTQKNSAVTKIAQFLQTLDSDGDASNGIQITSATASKLTNSINIQSASTAQLETEVFAATQKTLVSSTTALSHLLSSTSQVVGKQLSSFSTTPTASSSLSSTSSSTSSTPVAPSATATPTDIIVVDGYVKNALVKDAQGDVATYQTNGTYRFSNTPTYPITVSGGQLLDTNLALDINLTAISGSVVSPITTLLQGAGALQTKLSNITGLNISNIEQSGVDYVDNNDTNLSKLSQLFYIMLSDSTLATTFKNSVENNNSLNTLDTLFTLAERDINSSTSFGSSQKTSARSFIAKLKNFTGSSSDMETFVKADKENLIVLKKSGNPFITVWEVTPSDLNITIPTNSAYTYDYTVDWGDGNTVSNLNDSITHQYNSEGNYTVKISGQFPHLYTTADDNSNDIDKANAYKLKKVLAWGDIHWSSFKNIFNNARNMEFDVTDTPILTNVTDMSRSFSQADKFNSNINDWNVSNVTDMSYLFMGADIFDQPLNKWDVSNVTDMNSMFYFATAFNQNINDWNTSNVTKMCGGIGSGMFGSAENFNQPLDKWDVSKITDMSRMFVGAQSFNQNINDWNTSNVTDMGMMFQRWNNDMSFNQPLNNWDVSKVTNMANMFKNTSSFTNQDLSDWNVSSVANHTDFMTDSGAGNTEPTWP